MKIVGLTTVSFDVAVGKPLNEERPEEVVKEIKYFESSQVYNKFIHEPVYVVESTNTTLKVLIPVRSVDGIELETKKDEVVKPDLSVIGEL